MSTSCFPGFDVLVLTLSNCLLKGYVLIQRAAVTFYVPGHASLGATAGIYQAQGACPAKKAMWKPWVTGTSNNWKPPSWKHSQRERLLTNGIVCKALCKSVYEGGWAAGVLFTRLQWSLNTWKLASLNWAGQTDLWKVTHTHSRRNHFRYSHTTELYTEYNHSGKGPETTADLHSLLTSQKQSQTQNKATGWRLTVKRLFSRSRKICDLKFYTNCSETHGLQKLNSTFKKETCLALMLNWDLLWFLMLLIMWNLLKNIV